MCRFLDWLIPSRRYERAAEENFRLMGVEIRAIQAQQLDLARTQTREREAVEKAHRASEMALRAARRVDE